MMAMCLFLIIGQTSCDSDDDANLQCQDTVCTAIFIRISVSVTDQNQNPVALDTFEVVNLENGTDMTISLSAPEFEGAQEFGQYPLVQDGALGLNETRRLQFRGFIDGQEVLRSDYTVGTDCCHVGVNSGDLELSLSL